MKLAIMAGGPIDHIPEKEELRNLPKDTKWIGIDRGVLTLFNYGIFPEIAVGDFDSVQEEEMKLIDQNVRYIETAQPEKDETDMELALNWAIQQNPSSLYIFGATGKRQDHQIANMYLLIKILEKLPQCQTEIRDRWNQISLYKPGTYQVEQTDFTYISFIPISEDILSLTLIGFKYELKNRHISFGSTLCISNELIEPIGTFSFNNGILMMIRSKD
ncbi:thiamine diphosphokinase [Bacillus oleivorans]|uniref:Thiamine diphosphokinase n=1 Tax=Bacillus oleivorans TaxID=1448271 RepID=A0A285D2Z0_9BACI|nr:thiamine diphosphokinase [Bacillus oleivorans]SNX73553.1 thiamine diphosphokinase [Bacillus oleivorans]